MANLEPGARINLEGAVIGGLIAIAIGFWQFGIILLCAGFVATWFLADR